MPLIDADEFIFLANRVDYRLGMGSLPDFTPPPLYPSQPWPGSSALNFTVRSTQDHDVRRVGP